MVMIRARAARMACGCLRWRLCSGRRRKHPPPPPPPPPPPSRDGRRGRKKPRESAAAAAAAAAATLKGEGEEEEEEEEGAATTACASPTRARAAARWDGRGRDATRPTRSRATTRRTATSCTPSARERVTPRPISACAGPTAQTPRGPCSSATTTKPPPTTPSTATYGPATGKGRCRPTHSLVRSFIPST